jgi:nucleotide-binding universal stress UspA family protein
MVEIKDNRRIVVGVDGSESSKHALQWALRQAELTGALVDAINAWDLPRYIAVAPVIDISAKREALIKTSEQTLADTLVDVAGEHPTAVVHTRAVPGHPAYVLLQAADSAALLVLGCRGHGAFVGALLGSVSQYCVHHATCPVVVIREPHN